MINLKSVSIGKKVHVPLIVSILIGFAIILVNYFYSISEIKTDVYNEKKKSLSLLFNDGIKEKKI